MKKPYQRQTGRRPPWWNEAGVYRTVAIVVALTTSIVMIVDHLVRCYDQVRGLIGSIGTTWI